MSKLSVLLERRLDERLSQVAPDVETAVEIDSLMELARSPGRFDSPEEFRQHLREGALLNVGVIASRALSVPSGEYAVWTTDAGHTVLVPTNAPKGGDVVTREAPQYEIHTSHLMGSWNRVSRTIAEEGFGGKGGGGDKEGGERQQDHYANAPTETPEGPYTFGSKVSRSELWQAMKDRNMGDTELANAVGVDKSTISRLLRKVERGQEEPGGRNPSAELAMKISRVLGVPIDLVMPPESELIGKKRTGSSGSGKQGTMSQSRNGLQSMGQGNPSESRERRAAWDAARNDVERQMVRIAAMVEDLGLNPALVLGEAVDRNRFLAEAGVTSGLLGMGATAANAVGSGMQKLADRSELGVFRKTLAGLEKIKRQFGKKWPQLETFVTQTATTLAKAHEQLKAKQKSVQQKPQQAQSRPQQQAQSRPQQATTQTQPSPTGV